MPKTVKYALGLIVVLALYLMLLEPSQRYLRLLVSDTLPRLRDPKNAQLLHGGIPPKEWVDGWVPLMQPPSTQFAWTGDVDHSLTLAKETPKLLLELYGLEQAIHLSASSGGSVAIDGDPARPNIQKQVATIQKLEPENGFADAILAVHLWTETSRRQDALKALKAASQKSRISAYEEELFKYVERSASGRMLPPIQSSQAVKALFDSIPHVPYLSQGLMQLAREGGPDARFFVMKVAQLMRLGLADSGKLVGATLEAQVASLNPPLMVDLRKKGRGKDSVWVASEMSAAVSDRQKLETQIHEPPKTTAAELRVGGQWFLLAQLFSATLFLFVVALVAYIMAMPFARRLTTPIGTIVVGLLAVLILFFWMTGLHLTQSTDAKALEAMTFTSGRLMAVVWFGVLSVFLAGFLAACIPTKRASKPSFLSTYMAGVRDLAFWSVGLMLTLYFLASFAGGGMERAVAMEIAHSANHGEPAENATR